MGISGISNHCSVAMFDYQRVEIEKIWDVAGCESRPQGTHSVARNAVDFPCFEAQQSLQPHSFSYCMPIGPTKYLALYLCRRFGWLNPILPRSSMIIDDHHIPAQQNFCNLGALGAILCIGNDVVSTHSSTLRPHPRNEHNTWATSPFLGGGDKGFMIGIIFVGDHSSISKLKTLRGCLPDMFFK